MWLRAMKKQTQNKPNFSKNPKCTQTYILQRIMKMKPPSGPKKQTQNKPNSKPALSVVEWANPELAEALSAAEGAVEKFLSLCPASVTIIRKSVIRQFKRGRLGMFKFRLRLSMLVSMLALETRSSCVQLPVSIPASILTNKLLKLPQV
jgi:hypothetical protein